VFAALAVPLELPHRNVFVSYNFEANYNSPSDWGIFTPYVSVLANSCNCCLSCYLNLQQNGPIESEELDVARKSNLAEDQSAEGSAEQNVTMSGETEESEQTTSSTADSSERKRRALLTRSNIYHILVDKFQRSGFGGESCLLRLICEVSATQLGEVNGVLGSLMHVLFSPSTSAPEQLPLSYYQAELDGAREDCQHYEQHCGESLLDLISEPFELILQRIEHNQM
ncbi:CG34443, partial [Drosophila busckii]